MQIKKLDATYLGQMAEFFRNIFTREPWSDDAQLAAYIRDIGDCFNSINFGLFEDGKMIALAIGCKMHWCTGTECFIKELCVAPELQGKGIGTKFLEMVAAEIKKDGMPCIYLNTERGKPAYAWYKKMGFVEEENFCALYKEW